MHTVGLCCIFVSEIEIDLDSDSWKLESEKKYKSCLPVQRQRDDVVLDFQIAPFQMKINVSFFTII